jgi:hypothetical protein
MRVWGVGLDSKKSGEEQGPSKWEPVLLSETKTS